MLGKSQYITASNVHVAEHHVARLIRDIHQRGLQMGDRYLTDIEAAQFLEVSRVTAHRAMRELARQEVVVRRRRAGTFIGPNVESKGSKKLQCVHILAPARLRHSYGTGVTHGLRTKLPSAQVQFNFLPEHEDPFAFLRDLVDHMVDSGVMMGLLLTTVTREIRRFFSNTELPVVAVGHVEGDIDLPWISRDQRQMGNLLAQYMLGHGHRQITMLMRDLWVPTDNLLVEAVADVIDSSDTNFTVRSLPYDEAVISASIRELLGRPKRPTGLICGPEIHAVCAAKVAEEMGLSIPEDLAIVTTHRSSVSEKAKYFFPYIPGAQQQCGELFGQMLIQMAQGQRPDPDHYEIPVTLIDGRSAAQSAESSQKGAA